MAYVPGANKVQCQRCGFDTMSNLARIEPQTSLRVCPDCFDEPHPIDTGSYPIGQDEIYPADNRAKPADIFRDPLVDGNGRDEV